MATELPAREPRVHPYPRRFGWILVRTATNEIEEFSFLKDDIKAALHYHPDADQLHIERARVASMVRRDPYPEPSDAQTIG